MHKPEPLELYIDLRARLLAGEFPKGHLLLGPDIAASSGVTKSATLGVLNALSTDGYLQKYGKWFSPLTWTRSMMSECAERLEIFLDISFNQTTESDPDRDSKVLALARTLERLSADDERHFLALMDATRLLFRAGERRGLAEVVFRLIPQAFYRRVWNDSIVVRTVLEKLSNPPSLGVITQPGEPSSLAEVVRTLWLSSIEGSGHEMTNSKAGVDFID